MCYNLAAVHPPPTTAVSVRQTCVASEEIQESRQSCVTTSVVGRQRVAPLKQAEPSSSSIAD